MQMAIGLVCKRGAVVRMNVVAAPRKRTRSLSGDRSNGWGGDSDLVHKLSRTRSVGREPDQLLQQQQQQLAACSSLIQLGQVGEGRVTVEDYSMFRSQVFFPGAGSELTVGSGLKKIRLKS